MIFGRYFINCFLFLGLGCVSANSGGTESDSGVGEPANPTPQIVFLQYNFYLNDNQDIAAGFLNKIVTDGTIKDFNDSKNDTELQIHQLNSEKERISSMDIDNPLVEEVEFVNENRELGKKIVEHQEKEVFYRLQLSPETHYIEIIHFKNGKGRSLSIVKI
ncbi:MAG: hypothetical protein KTR22_04340 [Flavobacteriaceae bacterium]|nr:hypothetical protein [Flavobacteriaceae bacterium]